MLSIGLVQKSWTWNLWSPTHPPCDETWLLKHTIPGVVKVSVMGILLWCNWEGFYDMLIFGSLPLYTDPLSSQECCFFIIDIFIKVCKYDNIITWLLPLLELSHKLFAKHCSWIMKDELFLKIVPVLAPDSLTSYTFAVLPTARLARLICRH